MAKFKKTTAGSRKRPASDAGAQAERLSRTLGESAQQVWLAGVGAFARAQAEGTKLFEALVKEGMSLEQTARSFAGGRADAVRDAVENRVGQAREQAVDTWDKLEKVFEQRVQKALARLNVPGRDDLNALNARVDALNAELRKLRTRPAGKATASPSAPRKAPARKAAKKATVRKTARKRSGNGTG